MKLGFNIYDLTTDNYQTELTIDQAGSIVMAYANKLDLATAKVQLNIPRNITEAAYSDIAEIEAMVVRIMNEQAVIVLPTYDKNNEILTDNIFNNIPNTLDELKDISFQLIVRDYASKVQGNYTIEEVAELEAKIYFCIDKIIEYSKSTKDGDWDFFKSQF